MPLHTHTLPYTFIYAPLHIFVHMYFCPNHPYIYQHMNIYPYINQYLLLKKTHFYHALSRSILQFIYTVLNVGAENFLPLRLKNDIFRNYNKIIRFYCHKTYNLKFSSIFFLKKLILKYPFHFLTCNLSISHFEGLLIIYFTIFSYSRLSRIMCSW